MCLASCTAGARRHRDVGPGWLLPHLRSGGRPLRRRQNRRRCSQSSRFMGGPAHARPWSEHHPGALSHGQRRPLPVRAGQARRAASVVRRVRRHAAGAAGRTSSAARRCPTPRRAPRRLRWRAPSLRRGEPVRRQRTAAWVRHRCWSRCARCRRARRWPSRPRPRGRTRLVLRGPICTRPRPASSRRNWSVSG